jgi:hypothetical protein
MTDLEKRIFHFLLLVFHVHADGLILILVLHVLPLHAALRVHHIFTLERWNCNQCCGSGYYGPPGTDPLVEGTDQAPDPSIIKQK